MKNKSRHPSSFRDPSGYIFKDKGVYKRVILPIYFKQYKSLRDSGFYQKLIKANLLIAHEEISESDDNIVIQPEQVPFITYPYEWCFNQYKEAALLTLKIQKFCLDNGFSLKDASAYNITFHKGRAQFIDTLSFDFYIEDSPWRAYKQFIMHFLGPLVLAQYGGSSILGIMQKFIDGIPLKTLSSLLPFKTKLNPFLYSNIHLLAKYEDKHSKDYKGQTKAGKLTKKAQLKLVMALYDYIKGLGLSENSEWGDYYDKINYSKTAFEEKATLIQRWVKAIGPKTLIDIGGNDGTFVRKLDGDFQLALVGDIDNNAVDVNYKKMKSNKESKILPFVLDVLNPAPAIGYANKERYSVLERIKTFAPDMTLALALIHHMTLSGNVPFDMSARFFASFSKYLVIEFPDSDDSWVLRLLNAKETFKNHFEFYNAQNFEKAYSLHFNIRERINIPESNRVLYFLENNDI